jgi:iron complex transport system substrate-binding protein
LGSDVVGVSHECDYLADVRPPRLTRSVVETGRLSSAEIDAAIASHVAAGAPIYEVDAEQLAALRPDLVLTQGLCDVCALPARAVQHVLGQLSPRPMILSLDARSIDGVLDSIQDIGARTGREQDAQDLVERLQARLGRVAAAVAGCPPVSVVCLEWLDPPYACGHWIPEMVERGGGIDLLGRPGIPSVPIPWTDIERARPPLVVAMPCGYDLQQAARDVERVAACTPWKHAIGDAVVYVASGGGYFTRPGPRLITGIEVLASVFHPDVVNWPVAAEVITRWS